MHSLNGNNDANELQSRNDFDSVYPEIRKPEWLISGKLKEHKIISGVSEKYDYNDTVILSDTPNLYKQNGAIMGKIFTPQKQNRFIKFNPCEKAEWLISNHPIAYLLLNLVAMRAMRTHGHPSGLEVGECFLGDHKSIGATRGQYRHALQVLILNKFLIKVETCRNRKKATTGTTTVGTKVRLLDSEIWDINPEVNNHRNNHPTTTEQPPNNHEEDVNVIYVSKDVNVDVDVDVNVPSSLSSSFRPEIKSLPFSDKDKEILQSKFSAQVIQQAIKEFNPSSKSMRDPIRVFMSLCKKATKALSSADPPPLEKNDTSPCGLNNYQKQNITLTNSKYAENELNKTKTTCKDIDKYVKIHEHRVTFRGLDECVFLNSDDFEKEFNNGLNKLKEIIYEKRPPTSA